MSHKPEPASGMIQSLERMFQIIEVIKIQNGAGVTAIATELNLPKSTVHNQLKTLERHAYLVNDNGKYDLGLRLLDLGERARRKKNIYIEIEPRITDMANDTGERVHFIVYEQGYAIHIHTKTGPHAVDIGTDAGTRRNDLHAIAAGKVILAYLSEEDLQTFIKNHKFKKYTGNTITEKKELLLQLESIRERGYGFCDEESIPGLRAIAAPIQWADGTLLGVLSISGPSHRLKGQRYRQDFPDLLLGTSNEIEINVSPNPKV